MTFIKNKKQIILSSFVLAFIIFTGIYIYTSFPVLTINGKAICAEEFLLFMRQSKSEIVRHYQLEHGTTYSKSFWETEIDGKTPLQALHSRTIDTLTQNIVTLLVLEENEQLPFKSFSEFKRLWKKENKMRANSVKHGKVIYGPEQYEQVDYYNYLIANSRIKLLAQQKENKSFNFDRDTVENYFLQHSELNEAPYDYIKARVYKASYVNEEGSPNLQLREKLQKEAEELAKNLSENENFTSDNTLFVKSDEVFDEQSKRQMLAVTPNLFYAVQKLNTGDVSAPINDNGSLYVALVLTREKADLIVWEQNGEHLTERYIELCLEEQIKLNMEKAVVKTIKSLPKIS